MFTSSMHGFRIMHVQFKELDDLTKLSQFVLDGIESMENVTTLQKLVKHPLARSNKKSWM